MLSPLGLERLAATRSSSFACDLGKWHQIMQAYEHGGHAYHATMPTDGLRSFADVMHETGDFGYAAAKEAQTELGRRIRAALESRGYPSVAAAGFQAPGVVVSYTDDPDVKSGAKFSAAGMQIAAGVPLSIGEGDDFRTFRIGLFGLDKLKNVDRTVSSFEQVLDDIQS